MRKSMKPGPKSITPVVKNLRELLTSQCPKGHYPWEVRCGREVWFCYVDAMRKTLAYAATVEAVSVSDIISNAPKENTNE